MRFNCGICSGQAGYGSEIEESISYVCDPTSTVLKRYKIFILRNLHMSHILSDAINL